MQLFLKIKQNFATIFLMITFSNDVKKLASIFKEHGYEFYAVGGAVRDMVRGKTPDDIDFCTNATPQEMLSLFPNSIKTGIKHGTLTIPFRKEFYEVTTYRIDGKYSDGRHPDNIAYSSNLREDLSRRDFTINALALSPDNNEIIDLFGGINDLNNKVIRTVGNADARFSEDALRMLRAIRFEAKLGFTLEENTRNAIKTNAYLIKNVSRERIFTELIKTLTSGGRNNALKTLSETGLWDEILPFVKNSRIVMNGSVFSESVALTSFFILTDTPNKDCRETLLDLKTSNALLHDVLHLEESYRVFMKSIPTTDYEKRVFLSFVQKEYISSFFDTLLTIGSPYAELRDEYNEMINYPLSIKELAINGNDMINLGYNGHDVKNALNLALDEVLKDPKKNTKEKLISLLTKRS